jgi:hypothetical protein
LGEHAPVVVVADDGEGPEICRLSLELPTDRGRVRLPAHLLLLDGPRTAILLVLSE